MSSKFAEMAERTTILRAPVGSTIHGLNLPGNDDRDEMGVCIEDQDVMLGFSQFDQYIYRSAAVREQRHDAPSQPGDLDLTIYSLRKYLRLALQGNPTILTLFFVPKEACSVRTKDGAELQSLAPHIISRQAGKRYLGYLKAQRQRLLGERGQKKVHRLDLEEKYGYDTKYAMHTLRLGHQGIELLETGKLTLPMTNPVQSHLLDVRHGRVDINEVLTEAGECEMKIKDLLTASPLPEEPDYSLIEEWMITTYALSWDK